MTEEFLSWIWKHKYFNKSEIFTVDGEEITVLTAGMLNKNSGPDFHDSRIKIGNTLWAGNIEIHVKSSDWILHHHENDPMYKNVVLHVVYEHDKDLENNIPVLCIKDYIDPTLFSEYQNLINKKHPIACNGLIQNIESVHINTWLETLEIERLNEKSERIIYLLEHSKNDWAEVFYQLLMSNFGFKVNALPFEMLARSLPFKIILKHSDNLLILEALLFGQAGFLNEIDEKNEYQKSLKKEYDFYKHKYQLKGIDNYLWKFLRIRPNGFPTLRIAQIAKLFYTQKNIFSTILMLENLKNTQNIFSLCASEYWDEHFQLNDVPHQKKPKTLGKSSINNIILNTICTFLFVYGQKNDEEKYIDEAFRILENLPKEENNIIDIWEEIGVKVHNAFQSQALLQLKNQYCDKRKCLSCNIGNKILAL
jgi:hypothetical protein